VTRPASRAPTRVLLVDDAPEITVLIRTAMRLNGGFEVVGTADRGELAVQMATMTAPDVVVLDLGLPDLDGQEVLIGIQRAAPAAQIVIYSGLEEYDVAQLAGRSAGFVQKGTDLAHLLETVERVAAFATVGTTLRLPKDLASVGEARRHVNERLLDLGRDDLLDVARLVVSELAANAVTHANSRYEVAVTCPGATVRIAVRDFGPGIPAPGPPELALEHGRGLLLVAAMSSAWGVEPRADGKVVWAELRGEDRSPPSEGELS
jgi:DNA-binding response OmpR family regulator